MLAPLFPAEVAVFGETTPTSLRLIKGDRATHGKMGNYVIGVS